MEYNKLSNMTIYTDLDTLYDTKVTILGMIDPRLAREYFTSEYNIPDHILYLSRLAFDNFYKDRDKRVLLGSKNTSIIDLIRSIISDIDIENKTGDGMRRSINLTINTFPYDLDNHEVDAMKEFLSKYILHLDSIDIIFEKKITNKTLSKLNIMIRRDGLSWFMGNKVSNPTFKLPTLKLIVPDEMEEINLMKTDVDRDKLKKYLETSLIHEVCLEIIEKEAFMLKLENR